MRKLLVKILIFFFPLLLAIGLYFAKDPFKVLYTYNQYFQPREDLHVFLNRDFAGTETLLRHYEDEKQNAFIFGSSRSENYLIKYWIPYISLDAHCYHFSASAEGLYGVERKMMLLEKRHMPMKHALIAVDHWLLEVTEDAKGRVFMKHPAQSGQNRFAFQFKYFEDYLDPKFIKSYTEYLLTGRVTEEMLKQEVLVDIAIAYNYRTNELTYPYYDSLHKADPDAYYKTRLDEFLTHPRTDTQQTSPAVIKEKQMAMLRHIKEMLVQNGTDYLFVINPMYEQMKLNPADLQILYELFGEENVCDVSGKNKWTGDYHRHFDYFHFDYEVGKQVLDSAYARRARMRATAAR